MLPLGGGAKHQGACSACLKRLLVCQRSMKRPCAGRAPRLGTVRACSELGIHTGLALNRVLVSLPKIRVGFASE